jgi:lysophospholipase L1-like esterase
MRVIVVGDSLSDPHVGGGGYLTQALAACPKAPIENLAKGGFMVNQMRRKLEREVRAGLGPATHMVVFGGVNDVYSDETAGRLPHKIISDLSAIYALGRGLGARVIAVTISPWGGFSRYYSPKRGRATDEVNSWIRKQVEAGNVAVAVDSTRALSCGDPERLCPDYEPPFHDGLHFGPNGHRALGRSLAPAFADCR